MNFKTRNPGFTLIEVLLAVAIIALVLTPLFVTQGTLLDSVARLSRQISRILFAKQFMIGSAFATPPEQTTMTLETKLDDPETFITYEVKTMPTNSVFAQLPDLYLQQTKARWKTFRIDREERLVSFIFKPKPPEQKKGGI